MPTTVIKHNVPGPRDCEFAWEADFAKMKLSIQAGFVSPTLLQGFFWKLPHKDDRFARTGIVGAAVITKRFDTRLELPSGTRFKIVAHQPTTPDGTPQGQPILELFEVTTQDEAS